MAHPLPEHRLYNGTKALAMGGHRRRRQYFGDHSFVVIRGEPQDLNGHMFSLLGPFP